MKILNLLCLNLIFYSLFILFSAVSIFFYVPFWALLSLFLSKRSLQKLLRLSISWYGFVIIKFLPFPFVKIVFKDFGKNDPDGPYLIVCNHRTTSDAFLMAILPYECIQVVNIWPFRIPILGLFARLAGYLSIREMPFEEFSKKAEELLQQGVCVIAFPEGTRSGHRKMGPFHSSVFRLALKARCPIVPLCISGNENIPPSGSLLLHPGKIRIHKLPALTWDSYKDLTPFKLKNKVRDIMAYELAAIEGEG